MRMFHSLPCSRAIIYANVEAVRFQTCQQPFADFSHKIPHGGLLFRL